LILDGALELSAILQSGVYILLHRSKVVYVGKSRMVLKRLYAHRNLWERKRKGLRRPGYSKVNGIPFDQVFFHPCKIEELDALEMKLIQEHQPRYNAQLRGPPPTLKGPLTINVRGFNITINKPEPKLPRPVWKEEPLPRPKW
jgi:hypothetical protein